MLTGDQPVSGYPLETDAECIDKTADFPRGYATDGGDVADGEKMVLGHVFDFRERGK